MEVEGGDSSRESLAGRESLQASFRSFPLTNIAARVHSHTLAYGSLGIAPPCALVLGDREERTTLWRNRRGGRGEECSRGQGVDEGSGGGGV